jgi:hypothetical protein
MSAVGVLGRSRTRVSKFVALRLVCWATRTWSGRGVALPSSAWKAEVLAAGRLPHWRPCQMLPLPLRFWRPKPTLVDTAEKVLGRVRRVERPNNTFTGCPRTVWVHATCSCQRTGAPRRSRAAATRIQAGSSSQEPGHDLEPLARIALASRSYQDRDLLLIDKGPWLTLPTPCGVFPLLDAETMCVSTGIASTTACITSVRAALGRALVLLAMARITEQVALEYLGL